jgi:arabinose-5-phosphate isomerase
MHSDADELQYGAEVLMVEAQALERTARALTSAFSDAIRLMQECTGRVITTGVGKSGIAARKLAATLTSTGCPALFLHPSEAMHGDLGIVQPGDVVIAMSHSGESTELNDLLPYITQRAPIIALVGNLHSTLAQRSQVVIDASVEREACPLRLAPTASVVVAMALGDALAMTLQKVRGRTAEDYAVNHPGGRLGRRLILRVSDVIESQDFTKAAVPPGACFTDVVFALTAGHFGAVAVLQPDGSLAGIIAEADLRKAMVEGMTNGFTLHASDFMNVNPAVTLQPDELAYTGLQKMTERERPVSVAPVLDARRLFIGFIRVHDLVRAGL